MVTVLDLAESLLQLRAILATRAEVEGAQAQAPEAALAAIDRALAELASWEGERAELLAREQTARREAKSQAERFADLVDGIDNGIVWSADPDTLAVSFVSPCADRILGYPPERWLTEPDFWARHLHPEDRDAVLAAFRAAAAQGTDETVNHRFLAADGRIVWLHTGVRLSHVKEERRRLSCLSVDVTSIKQAEERIAAHARRQQLIAELGRLALEERDLSPLIQRAAEGILERLDVQSCAVLERLPEGLRIRAAAGLEREEAGQFIAGDERTLAGRALVESEPVVVIDRRESPHLRDPRLDRLGIRSAVAVTIGEPDLVFGVLTAGSTRARAWDELEIRFLQVAASTLEAAIGRRRAEDTVRAGRDLLHAVVEGTTDAIFIKDLQGHYLLANAATAAVFRKTAGEILGKTDRELFSTESARLLEGIDRAVIETGSPRTEEEVLTVNGQTRVFSATKGVYRDAEGQPAGIVGIARDVTEHKRAEEERARLLAKAQRARSEAEQAERARQDLVAIVSHDLKNPLTAILVDATALSRLAPDSPDAERIRSISGRMRRSAGRMTELIRALLDQAKLKGGQLRLELRRHPPHALVREAIESMEPLAADKQIRLASEIAADTPDVLCDWSRILQVLSNLLGNAIKFTPARGAVALAVRPWNGAVRFAVSDTGPGISPEVLPHVFDRFWAAPQAHESWGLGLAIAKEIVEAHRGRIEVASTSGKGSVFAFTLEVAGAAGEERPEEARPQGP